jgi:hypothetical protein
MLYAVVLLCMLHCMLFSKNHTWRYTAQTGEPPLAVTVAGMQASAVTGPQQSLCATQPPGRYKPRPMQHHSHTVHHKLLIHHC